MAEVDLQSVRSASSASDIADTSAATTPPVEGIVPNAFIKDVAVVGMACRLAGGNNSPEDLWKTILEKRDCSSEIPAMRWEPYHSRDVRNTKELNTTTSRGYFLDKIEDFDAAFFGISPKEAEQMDPQQRLSLEVCWEALETAGIPPSSLSKSDTAVFMGVNSDDYSKLLLEDLPGVEAWMGIGTAYCGVPNRISYHLDLMGPSTAVDAACASSLVAIHHGRQAIIQGESKIAIAGGVNALLGPGLTKVLDKAGAVSPDGACMSFDNKAHGYGRGEGAAIVILKGLEEAKADGDNIIAVLKGSAVAQDGHTNGIMAPNAKAQELVAYNALKTGNVDPSQITYVEAHATSTPLGDPTEVSAIASVYGATRTQNDPVLIGSVKSNVGHLEAGAGVVGFIKAAMVLEKGLAPPQANLTELNTKINWKESGVKVVQEPTELPPSDEDHYAAICSYGYGGTVSHAVIQAYPKAVPTKETSKGSLFPQLLLLSAPQEKRLAGQAATLASWLSEGGEGLSLDAIATTLAARRSHHDYRAAFVVNSHEEAIESLKAFADGSANEKTVSDRKLSSDIQKGVVWVFSGHGAQWTEMGQELLQVPVFRKAVAAIDHIVKSEMGFSAIEALENGEMETSDRVQALTYTMQIGLTALLRSKGLRPQAVIGHSVGEIAASVAAGALTPEEGALIVCRRAVLYRRVAGQGAMILVNTPFSEVKAELGNRTDIVAAIDSSPSSCVVSGEASAVAEYNESLKARGMKAFKVRSDVAFHSPMLDELAEPLRAVLADSLQPQSPRTKLYSSSNSNANTDDLRDIDYWTNNMVNPVLLCSAVNAAADDGFRLFLEVSSHPVVAHSLNEILMAKDIEDCGVSHTMDRKKSAPQTIQLAIAQLHTKGAEVRWAQHMGKQWSPDVPLTTWSHKPIWRKVQSGPLGASETHDVEKHNLLGQRIPVAGTDSVVFATKLDNNNKPFPGSHPLHGTEIIPAAVLINTFLNATGAQNLSDIVLRVPVAINAPRDVQIVVQNDHVKIASTLIKEKDAGSKDASWATHTTGRWGIAGSNERPQNEDIEAIKKRIGDKLADNFSIDYLDKVGVSAMGFPWAITEHYGTLKEMLARVDAAPDAGDVLPWDKGSWAPILDAATSVGSTLFFDNPKLRMPAQIDRVELYSDAPPPKTAQLFVQPAAGVDLAVDVCILSEEGEPLLKFFAMRFSEIEGTPGANGSVESLVHQLAWPPVNFTEKPLSIKNVVLLSDDSATLERHADSISAKSLSVTKVTQAQDLSSPDLSDVLSSKETVIVYAPGPVESLGDVPESTERFAAELLDTVKFVVSKALPSKVFVLTERTFAAENPTALAQAALYGLGRIIAAEVPDIWGALIDNEDSSFPIQAIKYVQGRDVIRIGDGIPRTARLRTLPRSKLYDGATARQSLSPTPAGTYLITGGLGGLGLEVADHLVEKGARRVVLVSRRPFPPRSEWDQVTGSLSAAVQKIRFLEKQGASIHTVAADVGAADGASKLKAAIDALSLPPVTGVVHAAGIVEDQRVPDTTSDSFHRVLSPKVSGGLNLHALYPPTTVDFFVLFSSMGQLIGFTGQSSYASGNAFLDTLATYRRNQGDNSVAFQWTSWREVGMVAGNEIVSSELESKGVSDVTREEAFRAWEHLAQYDIDHGVVLRSLAFDEGEPLPTPILEDIAVRRAPTTSAATGGADAGGAADSGSSVPSSGPELKAYLDTKIRECVVAVMQMSSIDDVDPRAALSDLGIDSVMTVTLRKQLQSSLKIKVPPTLTWSHPTTSHLVGWYMEKMGSN